MLEKGDIVALRDGRQVEILSVRMDGDTILRFDYLDRREPSPMRRTEYPSALGTILRKGEIRNPEPKEVRPYDKKDAITPVIIKDPRQPDALIHGVQSPVEVNEDAGPQVHPAVKAPAKPVLKRGKTDKEVNAANSK